MMKQFRQHLKKQRGFLRGFALLVSCALIFAGCAAPVQEQASEPVTIKIVHTNDIHGRSAYQEDSVVGFEKLTAFITQEQGAGIAELLKAVKYDAMTPGNHDWNYGKDRLKELEQLSSVPILAGNVTGADGAFFANNGTLMKTVDGVKIGVLGVFDPILVDSTAPRNVEGLTFADDAQKATELAAQLRGQGCDIVVALSHQLDCADFVSKTQNIDLLLAGHEHAVFDESYPDADGKQVPVMETGKYFEQVGLVSISYDKSAKQILSITETLTNSATAGALTSDTAVTTVLDGRREELRIRETTMGRVVTAAYLEETGADIAFENAGGIRIGKLLPVGDITVGDIVDTAPFGNYIVTKEISGEAVRSILERSIDIGLQNKKAYDEWKETGSDKVQWPDDDGNYLQFGGMNVLYDAAKPLGERVLSVQVGGAPLNPEQLYTVAANNYISLGKTYPELADVPELNQYAACDEALDRCIGQGQAWVDAVANKVCLEEVAADSLLQEQKVA